MALGGLLLLAMACSDDVSSQIPPGPATPDAQATITAVSQQGQGSPAPTAVPKSDLEAARSFAQEYQAIMVDLDQLHQEYDTWQAGLNACTQSAAQGDLHRFAGDFSFITQSARDLTRTSGFRELADRLIDAAEAEERTLRQLRDNWQAPTPVSVESSASDADLPADEVAANVDAEGGRVSLSEQVDAARSDSSEMLRQVADVLIDLDDRKTSATQDSIDGFLLAFQAANTRWDLFHEEYDSFRSEQVSLTSAEVVTGLSDLVAKFREVMVAVRELPRLDATRETAALMAEAADAEDLALRNLRSTFQKSDNGESSEPASDALDPLASLNGGGESSGGSFEASDPSLFGAYESQLVSSNATRREALDAMDQVTRTLSEEHQAGLAAFNSEYQALLEGWNGFHEGYDEWRRTEGGCDRRQAVDTLSDFGLRMGRIAASAGDLPSTNVLRPLEELLVEAVRREESSLKELSGSWRPFDSAVYQQHDNQRLAAGRLTRQVGVGIQELLEQYGIAGG